MKILLTAVGRRVELVQHLQNTFKVIGVDVSENIAAKAFVDNFYIVPRYDEKNYINHLIDISLKEKVNAIIPLYEREFDILNKNREVLKSNNIELILSDDKTIRIFNDKKNTQLFFEENNIKAPKEYFYNDLENEDIYPVIIKPLDGMGSISVYKANNKEEGKFFFNYLKNPIIQEYIDGDEYTVDLFCNCKGEAVSIVPRKRLEVKGGEVSKTSTVKDEIIISKILDMTKKIKFYGPITIQCIKDNSGEIFFIEVNPRFGGGVPATFYSGVNYGELLKSIIQKEKLESIIGKFEEKIILRYDRSVIV